MERTDARRGHAGVVWLVGRGLLATRSGNCRSATLPAMPRMAPAVFVDARRLVCGESKSSSSRCYGVDNLIVVTTDDAVLVARREDGDGLRRW